VKKFSEKILLQKAQKKHDTEAFAKLYDQYVKQLYRFIYFKIGSREEAEDITAEVFLKTWNYLQEKKEIKSFSGLLYQVARNTIIDTLRAKSSRPDLININELTFEVGDKEEWKKNTLDKMEEEVDYKKLLEGLKKLKHEYKEVLTLRFIDELTINEITEITGKKSIAIRVTIHRGLKKLKEILKNQNNSNQ